MEGYRMTEERVAGFREHLEGEEHGKATVEKYVRNVRFFAAWLEGEAVSREAVARWKAHLQGEGLAPCTVNAKLSALNRFFAYAGLEGYRVKFLHIQRKVFRDESRNLSRREYMKLLCAAREHGKEQLGLAMETIGATGIRVSELAYITVEAARAGRAEIALKGKIRTILLPGKLCRKLLKYAKNKTPNPARSFSPDPGGAVAAADMGGDEGDLRTGGGGAHQGVPPQPAPPVCPDVLPGCRDVVQLADVLGHSSIETTRIYLASTGGGVRPAHGPIGSYFLRGDQSTK